MPRMRSRRRNRRRNVPSTTPAAAAPAPAPTAWRRAFDVAHRLHTRSCAQEPQGHAMNFVSVRELRSRSAAVWQALDEERHLVVTSNGRPVALLSATSPETFDSWSGGLRQRRIPRHRQSRALSPGLPAWHTCRVAPRVSGYCLRLTSVGGYEHAAYIAEVHSRDAATNPNPVRTSDTTKNRR